MDKFYKPLLLKGVKRRMATRLPDFEPVATRAGMPGREVVAGSTLYRRTLPTGCQAWLTWRPGPGVERYFFVALGWSFSPDDLPCSPGRDERLYSARAPLPDLPGGCIDLEQIEGKAGIGGITIPSPWDQLLLVKPSAPRAEQQAAQQKAYAEALALSDAERAAAVDATLDDVFRRLEAQLPTFIAALG